MRVDLTTQIPVVRFAAFAEMAFMERRPELGRLCRDAAEAARRITPSLVQRSLPGVSDPAAKNIIRWAAHVGLCDRHGGLTRIGHQTAKTELAPIPEQGVYDFWVAEHPLLGSRLLHVERLVSERDQRFDEIREVPVSPDTDVLFQSVVDTSQRVVLRSLSSNHGRGACLRFEGTSSRVELQWRWDMSSSSDTWTLNGRLEFGDGAGRSVQHAGETAGGDVWGLFADLARRVLAGQGRWSADEQRLAMSFDDLEPEDIESFRASFELEDLEVAGFGFFATASVEDVPLGPATGQDAQRWALSRLTGTLAEGKRFHSREDVRRLWAELVEETPLERFDPELPSHEQLLAAARRNLPAYWSLAAPVDLSPTPVPSDALRAMQTSTTTGRPEARRGAIRIPHRSGWSMRDLVDRLVSCPPSRVVLCDRYVRGDANLRMLGLLSRTLREAAEAVQIEVVTDRAKTGPDNLRAIRDELGTEARTYGDVFGGSRREQPHDRYLLVEGTEGAFAWQMSNSPLDARAAAGADPHPNTPLRWRDLTADRLSLAELPAGLARLIGGTS